MTDLEVPVATPDVAPKQARSTRSVQSLVYVLHVWPYRESSLIVEMFGRDAGRFVAIAKGARRPRSGVRALLQPFIPILVHTSGKTEVRTLGKIEWIHQHSSLPSNRLMAGFYVNELLLALMPRSDPSASVFSAYAECVEALCDGSSVQQSLRLFEKRLLTATGHAPEFDRSAVGALSARQHYCLREGVGWQPALEHDQAEHLDTIITTSGAALLDIAADRLDDRGSRQEVRQVFQSLIARVASDAGSRARRTWQEYATLKEAAR
jgi:DNA repair protein RecO (recombination protein O)